jgi:starch synthase (maltosyl-transferring)
VVGFWCDQGVRIFRVDNPHTKAFAFWEWMIADIGDRYDGVIFLAEAFTRPKVMQRLAKLGFTQSYTYFPWRNWTDELTEYLTETSHETVDWFRPNSWPNTPDILTEHLQHGGRAASAQRAVLASTLTASYGVYGPAFELVETQARVGSEEYVDNEKYEYRVWDLDQPHSLAPLLRSLNEIRHQHPALQWDRTLRFHRVEGEGILAYSKHWIDDAGETTDRVLVVVNVDPHRRRAGVVDLDLDALDLPDDQPISLDDLLGGRSYTWQGQRNYVELDPQGLTAHVFAIADPGAP